MKKATYNKITTFTWTVFNGITAILIAYYTDMNYEYTIILIPALNLVTKALNKNFNPNFKE